MGKIVEMYPGRLTSLKYEHGEFPYLRSISSDLLTDLLQGLGRILGSHYSKKWLKKDIVTIIVTTPQVLQQLMDGDEVPGSGFRGVFKYKPAEDPLTVGKTKGQRMDHNIVNPKNGGIVKKLPL